MFRRLCLMAVLFIATCSLYAGEVNYAWVELGPRGPVARAISPIGPTPSILIDGVNHAMQPRLEVPLDGFPIQVSTFDIPKGTRSAVVGDFALPLPQAEPKRILVLGDGGCRIKGDTVQNCNGKGDGPAWAFPQVSSTAARFAPDLIIHVGDYLYRESPCPTDNIGCKGSPYGDNWATWQADFFHPVSPLLDAAPWVFARGNHEDCSRDWHGFFLFLEPNPVTIDTFRECPQHPDPYLVDAGDINLVVIDSANVPKAYDYPPDQKAVATYAEQINKVNQLASAGDTWTVTHRPFWAPSPFMDGDKESLGFVDYTLMEAIDASREGKLVDTIKLALAGHIHNFEFINFPDGRPPQIVSGAAGTELDPPITQQLIDANKEVFTKFLKTSPDDVSSFDEFAFLLIEVQPQSWLMKLYTAEGNLQKTYTLPR